MECRCLHGSETLRFLQVLLDQRNEPLMVRRDPTKSLSAQDRMLLPSKRWDPNLQEQMVSFLNITVMYNTNGFHARHRYSGFRNDRFMFMRCSATGGARYLFWRGHTGWRAMSTSKS